MVLAVQKPLDTVYIYADGSPLTLYATCEIFGFWAVSRGVAASVILLLFYAYAGYAL